VIRFLQPWWLLAVLPVLAAAAAYAWRQWRRNAVAKRFSNVELLRAAPHGWGRRRHLSATALLLAMLALATAVAGPSIETREPVERATIILTIDVSLSMQATDVTPSRIEAAQETAKTFVDELPASYNLGLVSFSDTASVLVSPSKDRHTVTAAIDTLQLGEATATGEAVFTALQAIAAVPPDGAAAPPPALILLLSDGYRTYGRSIEEAAQGASAANVPVSTIAFGTDKGTIELGIGGQVQPVPVDRHALSTLAELTRGKYYEAASREELRRVYEDVGSSIGYRTVPREVWVWWVGAGLLFALTAAGLSLLWTSRLP
jgi:Ca-activated chloride channel family protein